MGCFTKGKRLNPKLLYREKFDLPELGEGEYIVLRALTKKEADLVTKTQLELANVSSEDPDLEAKVKRAEREAMRFIALCAVDDDGERIFADADEVDAQLDVSAGSFRRMFKRILDISELDRDRAKN